MAQNVLEKIKITEETLKNVTDIPQQIELTTRLAYLHFQRADYEVTEELVNQVFELARLTDAEGNSYRPLTGGTLVIAGKILLDAGEVLQAQSIFHQALELLDENAPDIYYINCLNGLSWVEMISNNIGGARLLVEKAMQSAKTMTDQPEALIYCYNMLAYVMDETGFLDMAIDYYHKGLDLTRQIGDLRSEMMLFNNHIMTLLNFNQAERALALVPELEEYGNRMGNAYSQYIEDTIGQVFLALKDYPRAISHFKSVIEKNTLDGHKKRAIDSLFNLSKALFDTGEYDQAIQYALEGLQISEELGMVTIICESHGMLAKLYEQKEEYHLALEHQKRYQTMREAKYSRDTLQKIADLTTSFQGEASRKDAEILRLKNISLLQELEEHRRGSEELEKLANTDSLTGLLNRRSFNILMEKQRETTRYEKQPMSIAILDLDLFKQINDQYGHLVGDQVLVEFAKLVFRFIRKQDVCCRYGGDEFIVLLPDANASEAENVAERIRKELEASIFNLGMHHLKMTLSVGIASLQPEDNLESLLERADKALYEAKNAGRNRIEIL
jgi:diguanylate cyclase (GGDEF)-like protein